MISYFKGGKIFLIIVVLSPLLSGCFGFQPPTQDRKGYFQKKEFIFRSLDFQMNVVEKTPLLLADVTIDNPTDYDIHNLLLTCVEFSPGGNRVARHTPTLDRVVQQKSQQTFRHIEIGTSHPKFQSLQCEVTDFEIVPIEPTLDPSGTGLVQELGIKMGETNPKPKEPMIEAADELPASAPRALLERGIPERKELPSSDHGLIPDRLNSQQKTELVLRLLRGESLESVSRDSRVSVYDLENWQRTFLEEGRRGLEKTKTP